MDKLKKTVIVYLLITLFTIILEIVYYQFSHGMRAESMTYLFLCPLFLGCGVYEAVAFICPKADSSKYFRIVSNLYNTAVAVLYAGLLLKGIFLIAGSTSQLLNYYFIISFALFTDVLIILVLIFIRNKTAN